MEKIKEHLSYFKIYDVFGYLAPGLLFVFLIVLEYDIGDLLEFYTSKNPPSLNGIESYPLKDDFKLVYLVQFLTWGDQSNFKFVPFLLLIFACYLGGHLIAALSSFFIERIFTKYVLGYPSAFLLNPRRRIRYWNKAKSIKVNVRILFKGLRYYAIRKIIPQYTHPLSLREEVKHCLHEKFGYRIRSRDWYWLTYSYLSQKGGNPYSRANHFLNLYGFSRNCSMTFFLYFVIRFIALWTINSHINEYSWWVLISYLIAGVVLYLNYLKLFRRQAAEMYYQFYTEVSINT
jgi:hypothetical protein